MAISDFYFYLQKHFTGLKDLTNQGKRLRVSLL